MTGGGDVGPPGEPPGPGAPPLDLTGPEADELLRPATELAIEMAQTGVRLQPPLEVPSRLRPLLSHAKVTRAALATTRRAVEEDVAFREQVAKAVAMPGAEATLGRAGVLWLSRPDGWEAELTRLLAEARVAAAARADDAEERTAQRRLRHAEEARDRAERGADDARRAAELARAELQEERRLRRAAEDAAQRTGRHASSLEEQLAAARRAVEGATARLAERIDADGATVASLSVAEAELADLRAEVLRLRAALTERLAEAAATAATPHPAPPLAPPLAADRRLLGDAVAAASAAAVALGTALAQAAAALEPERATTAGEAPRDDPAPARPARRPATPPRWARPRPRPRGRDPAPLPPLVHDDSVAAAEHLVGLPNVALLVDGYNATLSTWPGLPLPEQRLRLVDALAELAARTGARPEVVFDGSEAAVERSATGPVRSLVKVSFTAHDVEADDVLIARAAQLPVPVVVASDDRRVRDGARHAGANVLGIEQLLAALRRQGPSGP